MKQLKTDGDPMQMMKNQLLIVLVERLGGDIEIPVKEVDDTGDKVMTIEVDQTTKKFKFSVSKKN